MRPLCHSISTVAQSTTSGPVRAAISGFCPRGVDEQAADFARTVVGSCSPPSVGRARALLFAASRLGAFCASVGLELDPEICLSSSIIERFVASCGFGEATRRTCRSNLRFLARRAVAHPAPAPMGLPRERAKAPYSPAEIASYLALADAQPTRLRRLRASALICLGTGAGLVGAELRHARGIDVVSRSGGVVVLVAGSRPRAIPVRSVYHERLLSAAELFGEDYLFGADPARHNVTTPLISSLVGGVDLPRLETARLRASYLVAMAEQIGLRAFMDAAGITCSQRLGDLVCHLEAGDEAEAVARLGGAG